MGLLDIFRRQKPSAAIKLAGINIDLGFFSCGHTRLGSKPNPEDAFARVFQTQATINDPSSGIEIGVKDGVLDYAFVTLAQCGANVFKAGSPIILSAQTSIAEVESLFGLPYWVDQDSDEAIFFYEYQNGDVELQFEFPGRATLGFITLAKHGVLSKEEQRRAYKVTKPWPPRNG